MSKSWRDHARPIIARVLADTANMSETEIKKALFEAYPFGERQYHPYRIWCDEIRRQRGLKPVSVIDKRRKQTVAVDAAQMSLMEME